MHRTRISQGYMKHIEHHSLEAQQYVIEAIYLPPNAARQEKIDNKVKYIEVKRERGHLSASMIACSVKGPRDAIERLTNLCGFSCLMKVLHVLK